MRVGVLRKLSGYSVAIALCVAPVAASASTTMAAPAQTVSPMVALSVFGSQSSVAALCGSSATAATATAAAAQGAAPGCVLPVTDAVPPPVAEALPPPPPPAGFGISPVLLGLAGIAILAALIALGNGSDNDDDGPISVT